MSVVNVNRVLLSGNLTRDPSLTTSAAGTSICSMRLATNTRIKVGEEWRDKANYVDITAFGRTAENCKQYLAKGRPVMVDGRLDWSEWTGQDGVKRQGLKVIIDNIQFLSAGERSDTNANGTDLPATTPAAEPAPSTSSFPPDDDIPF